jgi:CHAT domain-containing protein
MRHAPLPGTRREVEAIGQVKRLGRAFTVEGVREALGGSKRWRSVLFACHGLVDREQPWRSCLAVTAGPNDDGQLLARDVALLRIPADLTTLSACQTGLGKVVRGEGLLGLTRAVMVAGSPRVLASLWKVDDEATEAFMRKFYAVWNPGDGGAGLPAAEALRVAQAHVRDAKPAWKHPTYWAGWVLWGLPD